jgi:lysophospholipase L1-like esterase
MSDDRERPQGGAVRRRGRTALPRAARGARLLGMVALALLAAEGALRLHYLGTSTAAVVAAWRTPVPWSAIRTLDAIGSPWPRPDGEARWALQPWGPQVSYLLDEHGFRVAQRDLPGRPAGACRVLVAGDSFAFGYGVPAAQAFPELLALRLARAHVDATVTNGGLCGSSVRDQHRWLEHVQRTSPSDVVVLEVSPWSLRIDRPPSPRDHTVLDRLGNELEYDVRVAAQVSSLLDRSHRRLGHLLYEAVPMPHLDAAGVSWELEPFVEPPPAFARRLARAALEIDRIARLVRRSGARLVLVFVPLDVQVSRARNALYRDERLPYPAFGFDDRDYTADRRYAALGEVARGIDAPLVDASAALRDIPDGYLTDDYHLGPRGHAVVARELAPAVRDACAGQWPPARVVLASDGKRR